MLFAIPFCSVYIQYALRCAVMTPANLTRGRVGVREGGGRGGVGFRQSYLPPKPQQHCFCLREPAWPHVHVREHRQCVCWSVGSFPRLPSLGGGWWVAGLWQNFSANTWDVYLRKMRWLLWLRPSLSVCVCGREGRGEFGCVWGGGGGAGGGEVLKDLETKCLRRGDSGNKWDGGERLNPDWRTLILKGNSIRAELPTVFATCILYILQTQLLSTTIRR